MENSSSSKIGIIAALIALSVLGACSAKVVDPVSTPSQNSGTPLPTEVTLAPNTYADIANANLRVIFDSVDSDSRCPTNVACVWAGAASVQLSTSLISGDQILRRVTLTTEAGKDTTTVFGQALRLVRVDPTLTTTTPLPLSAYRVTIRVGTSR